MRRILAAGLILFVCSVVGPLPGAAAERPLRLAQASQPADSNIAAASADLDRLEAQAQNLRPGASRAKQLLKLLGLTENRLNGSPNKQHPSWLQADQRLQALKQRLTDLAAGRAPGAAAPAARQAAPAQAAPAAAAPAKPAPATEASESDKRIAQAFRTLREIEVHAEGVTAAQPQAANGILGELNRMAHSLDLKVDRQHPRWDELYARYQKVRQPMVRIVIAARANGIAREVEAGMTALRAEPPETVQQEAESRKYRDAIAQAREKQAGLQKHPQPEVEALGRKIDAYEKLLQEKLAYVPPPPVDIWGRDYPDDRPVLIDSIGNIETTVRLHVWQTRPLSWVPKPQLLVRFAGHESDDVVVMQVMKDGKAVGRPIPCSAAAFVAEAPLVYFDCQPKQEFGLTETGHLTLALRYRQTLAGREHDLGKLSFQVLAIKHGSQNNPQLTYTTELDMKMSVATIEETGNALDKPTGPGEDALEQIYRAVGSAMDQADDIPFATVRLWLKAEKKWRPSKLSCLYDGKKVAEAGPAGGRSLEYWSFTGSGRVNRRWDQVTYRLHALKFRPAKNGFKGSYGEPVHWLNENPGEYRCVLTAAGEVLKELYFTIGPDGALVRPACQDASMKTLRHVTLLRQVNHKVATVPYDSAIGLKQGYQGHVAWQAPCPLVK